MRKVGKRLERASTAANEVGTLLGIAAAGAELVSAIRSHKGTERTSAHDRGATEVHGSSGGNGHSNSSANGSANGRGSANEDEEAFEDAR